MSKNPFISKAQIRADFSRAMSAMYGSEVPLYNTMLETVREVNADVAKANPSLAKELGPLERVSEERHGAIRLGTNEEMRQMARLFAVMGMYPVDYYDLTVSNLPIHSTAFRPTHKAELAANPFRVFTSVLRMDIVEKKHPELAKEATELLAKRHIFKPDLIKLIDKNELTATEAKEFVQAATEVFRWHTEAAVSLEVYERLLKGHDLLADITGFKGPHINHLTPRVLDIDLLYERMKQKGVAMIPAIQGPPRLPALPLLRQTSFQALSEPIKFGTSKGKHRARFGEVEQRGIALTPKGRALYDKLLANTEAKAKQKDPDYMQVLEQEFTTFPQSYEELRAQGMGYFTYSGEGITPITYEDFLPVSAAGIFKSNLVDGGEMEIASTQNTGRQQLSDIVGGIRDPFALYAAEEAESKKSL